MSYKVGVYGPLKSGALDVYIQLEIDAVFTDVDADGEAERLIEQTKSGLNARVGVKVSEAWSQ